MGKAIGAWTDRYHTALNQNAGPPLRKLLAKPALLVTLMGLPILLFAILGTSLGVHWWHVPWPHSMSVGLLWFLLTDAVLMVLLFGIVSLLFFVGLIRGKRHGISTDRVPYIAYSYLFIPLQYGLIGLWAQAILSGRSGHSLLVAGAVLFFASGVIRPWLKLLQKA